MRAGAAWWFLALLTQEATETLRLPQAEFPRRRAGLSQRLSGGVIVLDAGPLGRVGSDANTAVFDFKYLTGAHDDEGLLVLSGKRSWLFVTDPGRTTGPVDEVLPAARFEEWAAANLRGERRIHVKLRRKHRDILERALPDTEIVPGRVEAELTKMRLVKSEPELRLIRKAAQATCQAHREAMKALRSCRNEKQVQDLILETFRREGCMEIGFPPICGAGRNGTILHYMDNNQEIPPGSLIVCDIGAAVDNYVSDITRTLPASGGFTEEQRERYQLVLDAQKAAEALLRPGASFVDLDRAARKVFEERGMTQWSYAHSRDQDVRHGLGHYVGMSVHDSGTYGEKFEPGMVITIEPGWYDKDARYGIRIEDIYILTAGGFERLSAEAPREIDQIERTMRGE